MFKIYKSVNERKISYTQVKFHTKITLCSAKKIDKQQDIEILSAYSKTPISQIWQKNSTVLIVVQVPEALDKNPGGGLTFKPASYNVCKKVQA